MAYIYIKSGGTSTGTAGKYADPKTGSWSTAFTDTSQYYDSLFSAVTALTTFSGDDVLMSHLHSKANSSLSGNFSFSNSSGRLISVDDSNVVNPLYGASESFTGYNKNYSVTLNKMYGVILGIIGQLYSTISIRFCENCYINTTTNSVTQIGLGLSGEFVNSTINLGDISNSNYAKFITGGYLYFKNCTFIESGTLPTSNNRSIFRNLSGSGDPTFIDAYGCDFSGCKRYCEIDNSIGSLSHRNSFFSRNIQNTNFVPNITRSCTFEPRVIQSFDYPESLLKYYSYGKVYTVDSIYRIDGATSDKINYFSYKVISYNTSSIETNPLRFKICDIFAYTSVFRTFNVFLMQETGASLLKDTDISLELWHKDEQGLSVREENTKNIMLNLFDTGVSYSASPKIWNGVTNPVRQQISYTTKIKGGYGLCSVYLRVHKPNLNFYVCPKLDIY